MELSLGSSFIFGMISSPLKNTNMTGESTMNEDVCISYWKWGIFQSHVSFVWDDIFIPKKLFLRNLQPQIPQKNRRLLRQQFETFGCKASPAAQAKGGTGLFIQKKRANVKKCFQSIPEIFRPQRTIITLRLHA